jgi:hypothetical protein
MFGMWQAGRRPHAGPVLLVALAVAVSTLAWSLLSTSQRSIVDQADFAVGADLRLVEANGFAPTERTDEVAALPGVESVAPVSRMLLRLGPESVATTMLGIDPDRGADVVRYRDDLWDGTDSLVDLAAARPHLPTVALPDGSTRLAATVDFDVEEVQIYRGPPGAGELETFRPVVTFAVTAIALASDGGLVRVPLGSISSAEEARRVEAALPARRGLSLIGFSMAVSGFIVPTIDWRIDNVQTSDAAGAWTSADLRPVGNWAVIDQAGGVAELVRVAAGEPDSLVGERRPDDSRSLSFSVVSYDTVDTVPVLVTAAVLDALRVEVGELAPVKVRGVELNLQVVGTIDAVPGTSRSPAAVIADLPTLSLALGRARPTAVPVTEHWVAVAEDPAQVAAEAERLPGVRVLDPAGQAEAAGREPYGIGGRSALFAAALGALLLAMIGIGVDIRATARRRVGEFAVLQTMGAGSRLLSRAVLAEQGFLAGLGVLVGLAVGIGVAATLAPLLILTPSADRPEPEALLSVPWLPVLGTAVGLFAAAMLVSGAVAATLGRRLAVARLRIGDET